MIFAESACAALLHTLEIEVVCGLALSTLISDMFWFRKKNLKFCFSKAFAPLMNDST